MCSNWSVDHAYFVKLINSARATSINIVLKWNWCFERVFEDIWFWKSESTHGWSGTVPVWPNFARWIESGWISSQPLKTWSTPLTCSIHPYKLNGPSRFEFGGRSEIIREKGRKCPSSRKNPNYLSSSYQNAMKIYRDVLMHFENSMQNKRVDSNSKVCMKWRIILFLQKRIISIIWIIWSLRAQFSTEWSTLRVNHSQISSSNIISQNGVSTEAPRWCFMASPWNTNETKGHPILILRWLWES